MRELRDLLPLFVPWSAVLLSLADTGQGIMETNVLDPTVWLTAFLSPFLLLFVPSQHTCLVLRCF